MLRKNTVALFGFILTMIFTLIDQLLNGGRKNNAPDEDCSTKCYPYRTDKELAKPSDLDDYSFNEIHDNSVGHTTLVREKRARKVAEEMSASVAVIARSMHREAMSLMDEMNAHEELMSREESEDAFFNHHYITPRIIDSKIITRNINALYIGKNPMTNRPVTRTRLRQRAVFSLRDATRRSLYGAPYKDGSMET